MQEYIHMRLRGGLPPDKTKLPTLSMTLDAAENAMAKLGWSYERFLFRNQNYFLDTVMGRENAEKWFDHYRQLGIDEKYFTIKQLELTAPLGVPLGKPSLRDMSYAVGNRSSTEILHEADPEHEKIIRDLCRRKGRYSSFSIIYQGIVLPHEHVTDCYIRCSHGGASVCVSSEGGWDVGIARRVTEEYAAAFGMMVDRQWYRNRAFY